MQTPIIACKLAVAGASMELMVNIVLVFHVRSPDKFLGNVDHYEETEDQ